MDIPYADNASPYHPHSPLEAPWESNPSFSHLEVAIAPRVRSIQPSSADHADVQRSQFPVRKWHQVDPSGSTQPRYRAPSTQAGSPPRGPMPGWQSSDAVPPAAAAPPPSSPAPQPRQHAESASGALAAACANGSNDSNGSLAAVQSLLASGADVNAPDQGGNTALDHAMHRRHLATAEALVGAGAVWSRPPDGMAQLLIDASKANMAGLVRSMINAGADITAGDANGRMALHHAVLGLRHQFLPGLAAPRTVAHADAQGNTPLHLAAIAGNPIAMASLLDWGVPLDARNNEGNTALACACALASVNPVMLLLRADADVSLENHFGQRPLHIACQHGRLETARLLLAHGADVHARTAYGETSLGLAQRSGHPAIAGMLMLAGATS